MTNSTNSPKTIDQALDHFADHAARDGIRLNAALEHLGAGGFCFTAFLLAVPFIQPVPLGPLTMVCGVTFMALGWQMARGKQNAVLPKQAGELLIQGKLWLTVLGFCQKILKFCRRFTRERHAYWVSGDTGHRLVGWLILSGGALLAIPAANLPLNNFFPALMILFACLGWLERDGLMIFISIAWGIATLAYFTFVCAVLFIFGNHAWDWIASLWK
jgi:hypothetical protein